jgi:hypothetical protein
MKMASKLRRSTTWVPSYSPPAADWLRTYRARVVFVSSCTHRTTLTAQSAMTKVQPNTLVEGAMQIRVQLSLVVLGYYW